MARPEGRLSRTFEIR
ncbi:hypothetical protein CLS_04320 [[Clostridium] cf. saccharolyticum K10]|nr:hypothetical protein CLS_04320 [[Clostridium] cf. saccharolyticum K10]